jgi:hypothetical protein
VVCEDHAFTSMAIPLDVGGSGSHRTRDVPYDVCVLVLLRGKTNDQQVRMST